MIQSIRNAALSMARTIGAAVFMVTMVQAGHTAETQPEAETKAAKSGEYPGFVHDVSRSRLKFGSTPVMEVDTPKIRRWRGDLGAWAIDPTNGLSMGIVNADAPTGPYELHEVSHNLQVRAYFVAAGLPEDQIHDVRATYQVVGGGPIGEPSSVTLQSINSILTRSLEGVPVIESVAWAKMNRAEEVEMEYVFWPPIDKEVAARAVKFARKMDNPAERAAFLAKLPGTVYKDGGVVIHHTDPSVHAAPAAYVAYDVTLSPEGHAPMRHFDDSGQEFRMPHELPHPDDMPATPRPKQ
jgi:hypothetical protein